MTFCLHIYHTPFVQFVKIPFALSTLGAATGGGIGRSPKNRRSGDTCLPSQPIIRPLTLAQPRGPSRQAAA